MIEARVEATCLEAGATKVRVDFGMNAYIEFSFGDEPDGWCVVDNRGRYPRQVAASLSFNAAVRFARQMTDTPMASPFDAEKK